MLSKAERQFLLDVLAGKLDAYSYHYRRVLRKRILDKQSQLIQDSALIDKAKKKLENL